MMNSAMSAAIIKHIIPDEKVLETKTKKDLLSYSGSWKEIDAEVFDDYCSSGFA